MRSGGYSGFGDDRRAEVGAHVEEVVLHVGEHRDDVVLEPAVGERDAELGVGLVDVGVGLQPQVVLRVTLMSPRRVSPASPVRV